jgi:hypothetical protein
MAVPIPIEKEFPKPQSSQTAEYFEGVEVTVPPRKVYTLQLSENTIQGTGSIPKGWYICKEGRSGVAIAGVDFRGEEPILVQDFTDPNTSTDVVQTQIRIEDTPNVAE